MNTKSQVSREGCSEYTDVLIGGILEQRKQLWNNLGFSGHLLGQVSPACPFKCGLPGKESALQR